MPRATSSEGSPTLVRVSGRCCRSCSSSSSRSWRSRSRDLRPRHRQDAVRPRGHRGHRPGAQRGRAQEADGHARRARRPCHPVPHRRHRRADDPPSSGWTSARPSPASVSWASRSASGRRALVGDYLTGALILIENQFSIGDVVDSPASRGPSRTSTCGARPSATSMASSTPSRTARSRSRPT